MNKNIHGLDDKTQYLKLGRYLLGYPWLVVSITLCVVLFASIGITGFKFNNDYRVFFSQDNPNLQAFAAIQNTFNKSDNILFVIQSDKKDIFNKDTLMAISQLTKAAWQLPYSSRVDSITNFQHTIAENDEFIIKDLVKDTDILNNDTIDVIKKIALNEPALVNHFISKSGSVATVNVTVQLPDSNLLETIDLVTEARNIVGDIEAIYPDLKLYLNGIVILNNALYESAVYDSKTLVPIILVIVIMVAFVCLRSITVVFGVLLVIVFSIFPALGLFSWFDGQFTSTSSACPVIILTVAVADSIHFLVTMLKNMREGSSKKKAIQLSLDANLQPILLTNSTTMLGFLTMNFSDSPPIRELGNLSALGVLFACILTISFLPALMAILPIKMKQKKDTKLLFIGRLTPFVIRNYKFLFVANTLIAAIFLFFVSNNELNDDFAKYFDQTVEFRQGIDFLNKNMEGGNTIELSIHATEKGGINEPIFLEKIELFSTWLKKQPGIVSVKSITDTIKKLNRDMHNNDSFWYKIPENRNLVAQYLLMYEMSLPYGLGLDEQISMDKSAIRVFATLNKLDTNQLLEMESKINDWLFENLNGYKVEISSASLMFAHIAKSNATNMFVGTTLELSLISLILMITFRSVRLGLISLIPNLVPVGIAFGIWGLIDGQVSMGISVVASICFGIVVDDTIHFMSKYHLGRSKLGLNRQESISYASRMVSESLWITTIILVSGFTVLSFSHFSVNSGLGILCAITISIALFMDLLFLPTLLILFDKK